MDMIGMRLLPVGEDLYVIKRTFKVERLQPVIDKFGTGEICQAYHCEKILRGKDGLFYLVDRVEDAQIVEEKKKVQNSVKKD
jgi:hypothetical protein